MIKFVPTAIIEKRRETQSFSDGRRRGECKPCREGGEGVVNKVILIGRLGADPEIRYTPSGAEVANFRIATSEMWTNKNGEKEERTEWHRIVAWRGLAKICGEYLTKGRLVYIEGKIRTRAWEDKEGNKRTTTEIEATEM